MISLKNSLIFSVLLMLVGCVARIPLRNGDRIVFFGDSITEQGMKPNGYVVLIKNELNVRRPDQGIEIIGAGVSGNRVPDLLGRVAQMSSTRSPASSLFISALMMCGIGRWKVTKGHPRTGTKLICGRSSHEFNMPAPR
jgi:hypothetical protein